MEGINLVRASLTQQVLVNKIRKESLSYQVSQVLIERMVFPVPFKEVVQYWVRGRPSQKLLDDFKWKQSLAFVWFPWNLALICALSCRCARCIFQPNPKVCCHGYAYYGKKWRQIWHCELLPKFFFYYYFLMKFGTDVLPKMLMFKTHISSVAKSVLPW